MVEIAAGINTVSKIIKVITDKQYDSYGDIGNAIFQTLSGPDAQLAQTKGSITKLLANYMIQPTIIVTNSMKNNQAIDKLIDLQMDMFVAFYMQAFEILRNVYGKDVASTISILGTGNGSVLKSVGSVGSYMSGESYDRDYIRDLFSCESLSLEDDIKKNGRDDDKKVIKTDPQDQTLTTIAHRSISITTSVKTIVDGKEVKHTIIMPLTVRARVMIIPVDELVLSLKQNDVNKSLYMRFTDWKAGVISTYSFLFCDDLIREYKQNRVKDKNDLMKLINDQDISASLKLPYDKMVGYEKYYKMVIMSSEDVTLINKHLMGNIKNERERQEFLAQLRAMSCTLVDENYDRCHVYIKDLPGEAFFSLKKLSNRKDSNVDLGEIVKALMLNKPPVF